MTNQQNPNTQPPTPPQPPMPEGAPFLPPMPPRPMTRRARWGQQLMAGKALITNSLPDWFATYAFATYLVALVGVNVLFAGRGTEWYFMLFGIAWVAGFFFLSVKYSREWSVLRIRKPKAFEKKLFQTGFWIRVVYAIFIFYSLIYAYKAEKRYLGMLGSIFMAGVLCPKSLWRAIRNTKIKETRII